MTAGSNTRRVAVASATPVSLMVLVAAVAMLGSLGDATLKRVAVTMLINLIAVIGVYTFTGNSGVFSFGHTGFMLVGAYIAALLRMPVEAKQSFLPDAPRFLVDAHFSTVPSVLLGACSAAALAVIVSIPLTRLAGLIAGLATFAVLNVVYVVARNWTTLTNGTAGLGPVPTTTTRNSALIWALVVICAAYAYQASRFGLRLRASREDEIAGRAIGINVARERGVGLVVSAFFVGIAGALYGQYLGSFTPDAFYLSLTFLTISMLVVGGLTSLSGAVVGTVVVSVLTELLRRIEEGVHLGGLSLSAPAGLQEVGIALLIIAILVRRPDGIMGGREIGVFRRRNGPAQTEPVAARVDDVSRPRLPEKAL